LFFWDLVEMGGDWESTEVHLLHQCFFPMECLLTLQLWKQRLNTDKK
jgi:hypothetical protein